MIKLSFFLGLSNGPLNSNDVSGGVNSSGVLDILCDVLSIILNISFISVSFIHSIIADSASFFIALVIIYILTWSL